MSGEGVADDGLVTADEAQRGYPLETFGPVQGQRLLRTVVALHADRDALRAQVAALTAERDKVLALHVPRSGQRTIEFGQEPGEVEAVGAYCPRCGAIWPCPTARALGISE